MMLLEYILYFLLTLAILVVFHEYGHYKVAKLCGVKVLRFSVGFGPILFSWRYAGTVFAFSLIPLGGYVKMLDKTVDGTSPSAPESYDSKSVLQKIAILFAGPLFNFILAFIVYWLIAMIGKVEIAPVIDSPFPNSLAETAGLQRGDKIVAIDGLAVDNFNQVQLNLINRIGESGFIELQVTNELNFTKKNISIPITNWLRGSINPDPIGALGLSMYREQESLVFAEVLPDGRAALSGLNGGDILLSIDGNNIVNWNQFVNIIKNNPEQQMELGFIRDEELQFTNIRPKQVEVAGEFIGVVGVSFQQPKIAEFMILTDRSNPFTAIWSATKDTYSGFVITLVSLQKIILGDISFKALGGPITIAQYATDSASYGIVPYLTLLALLSISLGVINLLPLPVLDGGRIVLCLVEYFRGEAIPERILNTIYGIGFLLVVMLMSAVIVNDFMRL